MCAIKSLNGIKLETPVILLQWSGSVLLQDILRGWSKNLETIMKVFRRSVARYQDICCKILRYMLQDLKISVARSEEICYNIFCNIIEGFVTASILHLSVLANTEH